MNEEEKKAIEILKDNIGILEGKLTIKYTNYNTVKAYNTILNLIEKLQKENEELKDKYATFVKMSSEVIAKVKDKIEELDERIKNPEKISYWDSYTISECIGIRRILQELLEKGKNE